MKNPPKIARLEDIDSGIARFESIMRDYRTAGGSPPEGIELKNDFLETLPGEIREGLMWRATEVHETFGQFVMHVRNTANSILLHRGKTTSSLNNAGENFEERSIQGEAYEEAIMAINRKFSRKGGGGQRRPPGGGGAGPGAG